MNEKRKKEKFDLKSAVPFMGFIIIFLLFSLTTGGRFLTISNIETLMIQAALVIVASVGAAFVMAHGRRHGHQLYGRSPGREDFPAPGAAGWNDCRCYFKPCKRVCTYADACAGLCGWNVCHDTWKRDDPDTVGSYYHECPGVLFQTECGVVLWAGGANCFRGRIHFDGTHENRTVQQGNWFKRGGRAA